MDLASLGIKDPLAAELYIHAYNNNFDYTKVKISAADIKRLQPLLNPDPVVQEVEVNIEEYRNVFANTRGKGERGDLSLVKRNLIRFLRENKNYTMGKIISIAKEYVEFQYGNYSYMRQADYFIYKYENGMWISPIKNFLREYTSPEKSGIQII